MSETPISKRLNELIGQYGLQCSESKELAPTTEFADQLKLVEKLERDLATAQKECEELREQICKDTFEVEAKLRAEVAELKADRDEARACLRQAARLARTRLAELGAEWLDPDATPSLTDAERAEGMENDSRITHLRICVERWRKAAGLDEGEGADKGV